jgi:phosphoribosylformylglycinamidine cyclo-ligase
LIRRIVEATHIHLEMPFEGRTLGEVLLEPTRIYARSLLQLIRDVPVKGMAHITGGGLVENVPRILPAKLQARLERGQWMRPAIFDWLQREGNVSDAEMHRVFNCGIGMVVVVAAKDAERAIALLENAGERAQAIGTIVERAPRAAHTVIV